MATRAVIRTQIARALGALIYSGTLTAATGTTAVDTVNLLFANNDDLNGKQICIKGGTGIGQRRTITGSTASSDTVTVPTWTTTPDTTSTYDIYDTAICTAEMLDEYIDSAHRTRQNWMLVDVIDARLVTNDLLMGAGSLQQPFGTATSGVADDSGGIAIAKSSTGTFTKETTIIDRKLRQDLNSQKIVSDGTNAAYLQFTIPNWEPQASEVLTIEARVYSGTAARVTIAALDGVTTTTSDSNVAANKWETLSKSVTIGAAPTQLLIRCGPTAGSAVTAYIQHIRVITGDMIYELPIPQDVTANFAFISRVDLETGTEGIFSVLDDDAWSIQHSGSLPVLQLMKYHVADAWLVQDTSYPLVSSGRRLRLHGQEFPTLPTADTDTIESLDEYIKNYAIFLGRLNFTPRVANIPIWQVQVNEAREMARRLEAPVPRAANSRAVKRVE